MEVRLGGGGMREEEVETCRKAICYVHTRDKTMKRTVEGVGLAEEW